MVGSPKSTVTHGPVLVLTTRPVKLGAPAGAETVLWPLTYVSWIIWTTLVNVSVGQALFSALTIYPNP